VTPLDAYVGAGSWQDLQTHGERSLCWSRFAGRVCDPVGDPHWSSLFLKDCTPCEGLSLEQLTENCLLWVGPRAGAGEESEEEGTTKTMSDELTTTSIPIPPVLLAGRR